MGISAIVTAVVGAIATAVSTTMGVVSSNQQAKAAKAQSEYQAKVAKRNAEVAQANADMKRQEGIEEARQTRMKNLQRIGAQQTAMAANGIDVSSGTALDVVADTAAQGELDALTNRYNAETQALAYERQANNFTNQSNLDLFAGQNAYKSGMANAVGTGLKGLAATTSVAADWYSPNSIGNSNGMHTEYTGRRKADSTQMKQAGYVGTLPDLTNFSY